MNMNPVTQTVLASLVAAGLSSGLAADAKKIDVSKLPPPATEKGLTYAKHVKPLFEPACFSCHGPEKQKGKLRLDSLAAVLKGSDYGKVVEPGKSEKSTLVHALARLDPDLAMPPEGKADPFTKEQIGLIRAWIDQGAK